VSDSISLRAVCAASDIERVPPPTTLMRSSHPLWGQANRRPHESGWPGGLGEVGEDRKSRPPHRGVAHVRYPDRLRVAGSRATRIGRLVVRMQGRVWCAAFRDAIPAPSCLGVRHRGFRVSAAGWLRTVAGPGGPAGTPIWTARHSPQSPGRIGLVALLQQDLLAWALVHVQALDPLSFSF